MTNYHGLTLGIMGGILTARHLLNTRLRSGVRVCGAQSFSKICVKAVLVHPGQARANVNSDNGAWSESPYGKKSCRFIDRSSGKCGSKEDLRCVRGLPQRLNRLNPLKGGTFNGSMLGTKRGPPSPPERMRILAECWQYAPAVAVPGICT
jgi:hypothetical protein